MFSGVFGVVDNEFVIKFSLFKIADSRWRSQKTKKAHDDLSKKKYVCRGF